MINRRWIAALLVAATALAGIAGFVLSQSISVETEARIVAQKHAGGIVEFGLEQDDERYLPEGRFILPRHEAGRWIRSTPVTIAVDVPEPEPVLVEGPVEVEVPCQGASRSVRGGPRTTLTPDTSDCTGGHRRPHLDRRLR